jgi:hypothetical protein
MHHAWFPIFLWSLITCKLKIIKKATKLNIYPQFGYSYHDVHNSFPGLISLMVLFTSPTCSTAFTKKTKCMTICIPWLHHMQAVCPCKQVILLAWSSWILFAHVTRPCPGQSPSDLIAYEHTSPNRSHACLVHHVVPMATSWTHARSSAVAHTCLWPPSTSVIT